MTAIQSQDAARDIRRALNDRSNTGLTGLFNRAAYNANIGIGDPNTSSEVDKYAKRMGSKRPSNLERDTIKYNGNASSRTRSYRNRGKNTGAGAAVLNRRDDLVSRYGNDPRIQRATQNILAKSTVWQ